MTFPKKSCILYGMEEKKKRYGKVVSAIGIAVNFALAAVKIVFGALSGLVSVVADGVNNLSDCGSGAVSLVSFRIAEKPADKEHPYGHQRAEYIASMIIGFFVLLLAGELFRESVEKIVSGALVAGTTLVYILLACSVAVKAALFALYRGAAKREGSDTLKAAATDSVCDCLATLAVIAGLLLTQYCRFAADGYAGLLVALFIVWEGIGIVREAGSKLLGQAPDPAVLDEIKNIIVNGNGVLGLHDLRVYRYGPHKFFATVHIEMPASMPALSSHEVIDGLERRVAEETGVELTAHLDPVDMRDEEAKLLEERIRAAAEGMVEGLDLHDFRLIRGAKKKVVFEAGIPFACVKKDGEVQSDLERAVRVLGDYEPVVTVERE